MAHARHAVSRMSMIVLSIYALLLYMFLYGPVVMIAFLSFNRSTIIGFPFRGFTVDWYAKVLHTPQFLGALLQADAQESQIIDGRERHEKQQPRDLRLEVVENFGQGEQRADHQHHQLEANRRGGKECLPGDGHGQVTEALFQQAEAHRSGKHHPRRQYRAHDMAVQLRADGGVKRCGAGHVDKPRAERRDARSRGLAQDKRQILAVAYDIRCSGDQRRDERQHDRAGRACQDDGRQIERIERIRQRLARARIQPKALASDAHEQRRADGQHGQYQHRLGR